MYVHFNCCAWFHIVYANLKCSYILEFTPKVKESFMLEWLFGDFLRQLLAFCRQMYFCFKLSLTDGLFATKWLKEEGLIITFYS